MQVGNGIRLAVGGLLLCLTALLFVGCSEQGSLGDATVAPQTYAPLKNTPPIIHRIVLSSATVEPNGKVTIDVEASDPDHDQLTFNYTSNCPGSEVSDLGCQCLWTLNNTEGRYCIQVTVSDGRQKTTERAFVTVQEVTANTWPGTNDR